MVTFGTHLKIIHTRNVYLWEHWRCLLDQSSAWTSKRTCFLSNPINKQGFINLLCDTITSAPSCSKIELRQCEADADTEIVSTAVEHLHSNKPVLLKADDTDILVLCLHQERSNGLYLERCGVVYDISKFRDNLPPLLQRFVIVLHGFFGNDTVSGFYGRPSRKALRQELWHDLLDELEVFLNSEASKEEIHLAGVRLTAAHYGCSEALDQEREKIFRKKCAAKSTKKIVDIARLPPTIDAIHLHSHISKFKPGLVTP